MTTPLPSRLRESARLLRGLYLYSENQPVKLIDKADSTRIAAELTEAADALEAGPWMPIETAPKDGTAVMLGNSGGAWIGRFMQFAQSGYRFDDPWRSLMLNHYHIPYEHRYKAPTHWMPLPAAPAAQVAQEGGGVATDGALSPHAAALTVDTVLERLDFMAGHEASAIVRDTAEAAAAMIRAARGVATDGGDDAREP